MVGQPLPRVPLILEGTKYQWSQEPYPHLPSLSLFSHLDPFTCPLLSSSQSQTEQLRFFPEPVWAVAAEAEVSQAVTPCQRLVEETERVGEEGGGKFSSSNTATPTLLRRVNMQEAATHLLLRGLYFSMELRLELPSLPPTAYNQPSIDTRSWVLLEGGNNLIQYINSTPCSDLFMEHSSGVNNNLAWWVPSPPHSLRTPGILLIHFNRGKVNGCVGKIKETIDLFLPSQRNC